MFVILLHKGSDSGAQPSLSKEAHLTPWDGIGAEDFLHQLLYGTVHLYTGKKKNPSLSISYIYIHAWKAVQGLPNVQPKYFGPFHCHSLNSTNTEKNLKVMSNLMLECLDTFF